MSIIFGTHDDTTYVYTVEWSNARRGFRLGFAARHDAEEFGRRLIGRRKEVEIVQGFINGFGDFMVTDYWPAGGAA